jgi:hypothetical protein
VRRESSFSSAGIQTISQGEHNAMGNHFDGGLTHHGKDNGTGNGNDAGPPLHDARILVIRHAEKDGDKSDDGLSQAGQERADQLITRIPELIGGMPDFLIATAPSKHSNRPVDTLLPLANNMHVGIDGIEHQFSDDDFQGLARELQKSEYEGKKIVVDWHHSKIPDLAGALGAPDGTYPAHWPKNDFDDGLMITFDHNGIKDPPTVEVVHENINTSNLQTNTTG